MLANWKTSVAGLLLIAVGVVAPLFGVEVPGFHMDPGTAVTMGIGLILSKDYNAAQK